MSYSVGQQSSEGEYFPSLDQVQTSVSFSGVNHDMVLPSFVSAGNIMLAIIALADGGGLVPLASPWTSAGLYVSSDTGLTMAAYYTTDIDTVSPVNVVSNNAACMVAHVMSIFMWATPLLEISSSHAFDTFEAPTLTPAWGEYSNLWIAAAHTSMSGTYSSMPTGSAYDGLNSDATGSTTSDAQLYTCAVSKRIDAEAPGAWSFGSPSGKWGAGLIAIRGSNITWT